MADDAVYSAHRIAVVHLEQRHAIPSQRAGPPGQLAEMGGPGVRAALGDEPGDELVGPAVGVILDSEVGCYARSCFVRADME